MTQPIARVALAALAALLLIAAPASAARTDNRTKPVLLVHGLDFVGDPGVSCTSTFSTLKTALQGYGHSSTISTVKYYEYDSGCNVNMNTHGNHTTHYASGHYASGGHGANTDIRHLGYHLAWYIHNTYSSKGITIDLVGHSMGGLIIRYAVGGSQNGLSGFPPPLRVEDGVTLGSPHGGARGWGFFCPYTQCDQMDAGSSFLVGMQNTMWNPQGNGGTDWSALGSDDDDVVAADRAAGTNTSRTQALYFGSCHKVWYLTQANIEHSDFMQDTGDTQDYSTYYTGPTACASGWITDTTFYRPVKYTDIALTYGTR